MFIRIRTNIYRRKIRKGQERWMVRWRSPTTLRWMAITAGRTKDEALIVEARIRQTLARGEDPAITSFRPEKQTTFEVLINDFYNHSRFLQGTSKWKEETKSRLEKYIKPYFTNKAYSQTAAEHYYKFYLSLKNQGLGRPTIVKVHTLLCFIGDIYIDAHPDGKNIARSLKDFSRYFPSKAPQREINFLTLNEISALVTEIDKSPSFLLPPFIKFLINTGMRRGEAFDLKWADIDYSEGFVRIRKSKTGQARSVPLEPLAVEALTNLPKNYDHVFCNPDGSRPLIAAFRMPLRRAAKRAGIKKRIDLHTLRHSYGSNKIRQGWGLKKVSMLLGHADITMTSKVYSHLLDGDLKVRDEFAHTVQNDGLHAPLKNHSTIFGKNQLLEELIQQFAQQLGINQKDLDEYVVALRNSDLNQQQQHELLFKKVLRHRCYSGLIEEGNAL